MSVDQGPQQVRPPGGPNWGAVMSVVLMTVVVVAAGVWVWSATASWEAGLTVAAVLFSFLRDVYSAFGGGGN